MNINARRNRLAIVLTATAMLGGLMLTGCTPADPDPTPEPTETSTPEPTATTAPAPESEAEAIAAGEQAIATYLEVRADINAAGGTETDPLKALATGPALRLALDDAGRIAEASYKTEGVLEFSSTMGYAVDLVGQDGTAYPFSSVNITGCQDGSNYKVFNSDGTPAQQPTEQRNVLEFNVIWEPNEQLWLVNTVIATGETC